MPWELIIEEVKKILLKVRFYFIVFKGRKCLTLVKVVFKRHDKVNGLASKNDVTKKNTAE